MAASRPRWLMVLQAHLRVSPKKTVLLGALSLVLLALVIRQLGGGAHEADAAAALPSGGEYLVPDRKETVPALPARESVPLPPLPDEPARDPFAVDLNLFELIPGAGPSAPKVADSAETGDPAYEALLGMRLQSTVTGPDTMATINGKVVRVGDSLNRFAVKHIGARFVVLAWENREFVLWME